MLSLKILLSSKTEKIDELQGLLDYKQKKLDAEIKESEANLSQHRNRISSLLEETNDAHNDMILNSTKIIELQSQLEEALAQNGNL